MKRPNIAPPLLLAVMLTGCVEFGGGGGGGSSPDEQSQPAQRSETPPPAADSLPAKDGQPGPSPSPMPAGATLGIAVSEVAPAIKLKDAGDVTLTLTPSEPLPGEVALSVEGLPEGVMATFDPPTATLSGKTTVRLSLRSRSDATPGPANLSVKAVVGSLSVTAPVRLTVQPELVMRIAKGVNLGNGGTPNLTAFGDAITQVIMVPAGTKVTFFNDDAIAHRIHGNGNLGFSHQNDDLQPNAANSYTVTLTGTGTIDFNCHIHSGMRGRIVVK